MLAVWITREGFDHILSKALTGAREKELGGARSDVRLQWDPDHTPHGGPTARRAIQLGLRNEVGVALCQCFQDVVGVALLCHCFQDVVGVALMCQCFQNEVGVALLCQCFQNAKVSVLYYALWR